MSVYKTDKCNSDQMLGGIWFGGYHSHETIMLSKFIINVEDEKWD